MINKMIEKKETLGAEIEKLQETLQYKIIKYNVLCELLEETKPVEEEVTPLNDTVTML